MKLSRKFLIGLALLGLLVSVCLWIGIKIGRPLYYSDGNVELRGAALQSSGMLRWSEPELEFEIPGPVRGRVTELPDGRLIYGLVRSPSVTDLVVFDPRHPGDPVQPVIELNSPGHDLAPVLGPGGRLYFASDRPSGPGGFDLYSATYREGLFFAPRVLPEGINTGLDESDPTVDSAGGQIVFVRRDPEKFGGSNGTLMVASFATPDTATPVFSTASETTYRRRQVPPVDRDPMFAPDGVGLYFVRRTPEGVIATMRTSWHADHYTDPMRVAVLQKGGPFRSPAVVADGFGMRLVGSASPTPAEDGKPAEPPRVGVFQSRASEVYPFWEGQHGLEWLLFYAVLFFGSLLVLLTLGARWSSLDFITKLLILSLLIHLLILLWLGSVEIIRSFEPRGPESGAVQVQLLSRKASAGDSGSQAPSESRQSVAQNVAFQGYEQAFDAAGPGVEVEAQDRELEAAAPSARPSYEPSQQAADAAVADAAAPIRTRDGRSREAQPTAQTQQIQADAATRTEAARVAASASVIEVTLPETDAAVSTTESARTGRGAAVPAPSRQLPAARAAASQATLADAAPEPSRRQNVPAAAGAAAALRALAAGQPETAAETGAAPSAARAALPESTLQKASPAGGSLSASDAPRRRASPRASAPASAFPKPKKMADRPVAVADRPQAQPVRGARASVPAAESVAAAATGAPDATSRPVEVQRGARGRAAPVQVQVPGAELAAAGARPRPRPAAASSEPALPKPRSAARPVGDVALADDPDGIRPGARRGQRATGDQAIAATDLNALTARADASARARRGAPTGDAPAPRELPVPGSALARPGRRPTASDPRSDPAPAVRAASRFGGAVALRDAPVKVTNPNPGARSAATPAKSEVAAADLGRMNARPASPAPTPARTPARGDPTGQTQPEQLNPGSMMETLRRRASAPGPAAPAARPVGAQAARPGAVALRDDARPGTMASGRSGPKPAPGLAAAPAALAEVRPRPLAGIARPQRDENVGGLRSVSIGLEAPGSLLGRAGERPAVPAVVAAAPLTLYSNRFGASKIAALKRYGGSKETERAVQRGLAYLKRIQNRNGHWGDSRSSQRKYGQSFIGKTGLCLLAFLGAGHTPDSKTEYSDVTRRAVNALLSTQRAGGHFGVSSSYSHGITMYALAECFALTKDERLRQPLQRAVNWALRNQRTRGDRRNLGGWGYFSSTLRSEDPYARTSTTAWQVMGLESARMSGIDVPARSLTAARKYLLSNYDRRYRYFLYNKEPERLRSEWRTLPASTPAAVFCLQLLGVPSTAPSLEAGLSFTLSRRPQRYRRYSDDEFVLRGAGNVYFWYYSTLACFLAGGEAWDQWNASLKRVLLAGQDRDGSFPIIDSYAKFAGDTDRDRSYTTAMCVLSLEVYYRYFTPLLKKGK